MSTEAVPDEFIQGTQHHLQPDDPLLSAAPRTAVPPHARPSPLCLPLLLSHAGRGPLYPLGLEGLTF